jgi:ATP-binding cassette subfamily B protein
VANLGTLGIIWVGGLQAIDGSLSIGELVAFNSYLSYLLMPIFILGNTITSLSQSAASAKRVFEVMDAPYDVTDKPGAIQLTHLHGRVEFQNVYFRYAGSEVFTLEDVSFVAEEGQTIALLGRTGSGKSSLVNLIPRFYNISGGRIMIDEYDIQEVGITSLRAQIGIALQEAVLFSGTIRDNIAYGRPKATFEEVEAAAKAAQAHEFIMAFSDGYDTIVGERGVGLSGGQRQRLAIARTLLLDPALLILDDSTSAVDAETEYQIQQALQELMKNRTSFIIAQRINTVRNADLILLLDKGKLVAKGTHEQLLAESQLYFEFVSSQLTDDTKPALVA